MIRNFAMSAVVGLLSLLIACAPKQYVHGNMVLPSQWQKITIGTSKRNDVIAALGSPTMVATFDDNIWFYVGRRLSQTAFLDPKVEDYQAHLIAFDESGIVRQAKKFTQQDLVEIEMFTNETPTSGREVTAIEQILGNFGRFSGGGN
ncbi:MAG: outer membrane protein assembly factor BamE [Pseudomonadota bacterium]